MMLKIEFDGEINIGFAVQQVAQVQTWPPKMYSVDLKIAPVEGSVSIVVINFALTLWIFGTLYS